ncbi:MAG TPA: GNAT family N-acetyltransferase [Acidimicrobiales bacterium]|jgi:GNAT superfamily N-acetyltransferase|nr:GNAT family N-acetyltransferase [Acidimicrobiales bacterium]
MDVVVIDPHDAAAFDAWFDVLHVTDLERWPDKPGWQRAERLAWALSTDGAEEHRCLAVYGPDGAVLGIADLEMFRLENTHVARVDVRVLPEARRRGVGRAIMAEVEGLALGAGRTELGGMDEVPVRAGFVDPGAPFAESLGFASAQHLVRRSINLPVPAALMQALAFSPKAAPAGYSLITFRDRWPDEFITDRCELGRRMSTDIPMGEQDLDEEVWDEQRVRRMEAEIAAQNRSKLTTAAHHDATRTLVAFTEVAIPLGAPSSSWQHDTLVMREHRGHGLGYAVKVANLAAVMETYPDVRTISTWNAAENEHMIAVNEEIGFEVVAHSTYWLKKLG